MWGGAPDRNMVSDETGLPVTWDIESGKNVKWTTALGTTTYGVPVVAGGKIFVGTNNGGELRPEIKGDKGVLVCLDEKTGAFLWQATHDKLPTGSVNDWPEQGIVSAPWVEGDRLYYVSNQCQLVCADVNGFTDGENDGPLRDEKHHQKQDADFVWILDMFKDLKVRPHNLATCSPVGWGDLLFVTTSNGVDKTHEKVEFPNAPDLLAANKNTGEVVWQRNDAGANVLHGQWSSPALGMIQGKPQVIFAGGDGWCYAYEPKTGEPIWKFNLNPADAKWVPHGRGTKSGIIGTPVVYDNKVFVGVGQDPEHGDGPGHLYAIDATGRGDITKTGRVWHVGDDKFGRTLSTVAIADGLVYAAELSGYLQCLDLKTGQQYWRHDAFAAVWGSPFVADGNVYLGTTDGEIIVLKHGKELVEVAVNDVGSTVYSTPVVSSGVMYISNRRALLAISKTAP